MTEPIHFTEEAIARALAGARKAGLKPSAVIIAPDGSITVYEGLNDPTSCKQDSVFSISTLDRAGEGS